MRMPLGDSWISTILASAGGGLITYVATRIFTKSEDSASKQYVDSKCEKLDDKLNNKVDKTDLNVIVQRLEKSQDELARKQDMIISLLLEQRKQSQ